MSSNINVQPTKNTVKHKKTYKKPFGTEHESFKRDCSLGQLRPRGQIQVNQISITELKSPCVADIITLIIVLLGGTQKRTSWSLRASLCCLR